MDWGSVGAGVGGGVIGGLADMFMGDRNAKRDYRLNEQAADNAAERERKMWDYTWARTNTDSQIKQMRAQGLNVGLLYGSGGR